MQLSDGFRINVATFYGPWIKLMKRFYLKLIYLKKPAKTSLFDFVPQQAAKDFDIIGAYSESNVLVF